MTNKELFNSFHNTLKTWNQIFAGYSWTQLTAKPGPEEWSTGEVCMHLSNEAIRFNIPQISICLAEASNHDKPKSAEGEKLFAANSFPDKKIKFPTAGKPPMPESLEEIKERFQEIKGQCSNLEPQINSDLLQGKTRHPGLGWLNASEWYQFMDMHFRHHFRQESRIKAYLLSKDIH